MITRQGMNWREYRASHLEEKEYGGALLSYCGRRLSFGGFSFWVPGMVLDSPSAYQILAICLLPPLLNLLFPPSTMKTPMCALASLLLSEGNGNPPQHSCLGNPMDREAWPGAVHGVAKELDTTGQLNNKKKISQHESTHQKWPLRTFPGPRFYNSQESCFVFSSSYSLCCFGGN